MIKVRKYADMLLGKLFPRSIYCVACGSLIDSTRKYSLCDNCIEKFIWVKGKTCSKCGKVLNENYQGDKCKDCIEDSHYFDRGFTCSSYGLYERTLISKFKKDEKTYIGRVIGDILYDRIVIENLNVDVIISIPIHTNKKNERGFNQAEIMAKFLARKMEIPFMPKSIYRKKETIPMKKLDVWERRENMKNAFIIRNKYKGYLKDKNLLVIDDIYTTGATFDECSKIFKEIGVGKVYILTFAAGSN